MKPGIQELREKISNITKLIDKARLSIFLVCLCISIFIWLLIKMSKDYSSEISYPVKFFNPPANQIINKVEDSVIFLQIDTKGFDLINKIYFQKSKPINIDLTNVPIHKSRYSLGSYVLSQSLINQVKNQTEFSRQISRISPDTLHLVLENTIDKEVKINLNIDIQPKQQHYIYGKITQSEQTVNVSGPPSIIDTLSTISTEYVKLVNIQKNQLLHLKLLNPYPNEGVRLSVDSIDVTIPIEQFTENSLNIPIRIDGNSGQKIKLFPESISILYMVALKDFERVTPDMFSAVIHFNPKLQNYQEVNLERYPSFIKIVDYNPKSVEYLILMNND